MGNETCTQLVLILVLVEHTLGVGKSMPNVQGDSVLILVLVEHTLGVDKNGTKNHNIKS